MDAKLHVLLQINISNSNLSLPMAKNPDTTHSAQKLVQATASASYGEMRDGPSTSHSAQKPVKVKVSAGYGEMSSGDSGSRFSGQVPDIPVVPVAHASVVSLSRARHPYDKNLQLLMPCQQ